jgi:thiol:disulfide interchange protein DsbD
VRRVLAALLVAGGPLAAQQPSTVTNPHLTISLVPARSAVTPGQPLRLAVRLQAEPGWHVYWRNPGQSGIATTVRWTLPRGFRSDSLAWPVPELYDIAGVITHVLHGESVLLTSIVPPATAASSPVRIGAEIRYGVCKEVCLAGSARLGLELAWDVGQPKAESGAWRASLRGAEARRPLTGGPEVRAVLRDTLLVLTVRAVPGQALPDTLTFFATDRDVLAGAARIGVRHGATSATLLAALRETPSRLRGVLVGGSPSAARPVGWAVDLPVRSEK